MDCDGCDQCFDGTCEGPLSSCPDYSETDCVSHECTYTAPLFPQPESLMQRNTQKSHGRHGLRSQSNATEEDSAPVIMNGIRIRFFKLFALCL